MRGMGRGFPLRLKTFESSDAACDLELRVVEKPPQCVDRQVSTVILIGKSGPARWYGGRRPFLGVLLLGLGVMPLLVVWTKP